jgi:hypothetical protein
LFGPVTEVIPGLNPQALTLLGDRSEYLKPFFTSDHMDHHLLTFAEFASTYLMAWNGGLWEPLTREQSVAMQESMQAPRLLDGRLVGGAIGARRTRKVFANIICYMIFDDHEVTDDWFLNDTWETDAVKHDAAIRIMTNGMAAYWAFQGWGNDPEASDDAYRNMISNFAVRVGRNTAAAWAVLRKTDWSFMAPTSPPALFLDTRTRRESSPAVVDKIGHQIHGVPAIGTARRNTDAPRLINTEGRSRVAELRDKYARRNSPLIVVAPAPVLGFPPLEWIQSVKGKISPAGADLESWAANPRNLIDAMELFSASNPRPLIILSGDVHYGFEIEGRIFSESGSVPFLQLCSSALKNRTEGALGTGFNFLAHFDSFRSLFRDEEISFVYWDLRKKGQTDGPITYARTKSLPAKMFDREYGGMSGDKDVHLLNSRFIKREGRKIGEKRIEKQNNLGELIISGNTVQHQHWYPNKDGNAVSHTFQTWDTNDWPIKGVADLLLDALGF